MKTDGRAGEQADHSGDPEAQADLLDRQADHPQGVQRRRGQEGRSAELVDEASEGQSALGSGLEE
ncbi:hypothetical protein [Kitasatospora griseola]|uniref:hypothetical protein n=1 Tax=Kitasatospora griseola TaxID=2064 RepID=UPI001670BB70|nr:hypothetical protein [Kitasatospora griseola]GGQ94999.1 hypothetical protein GCM10010195_58570 [Kitasatospora griseola]